MNVLLDILQNEADAQKMREKARNANRACARLTPIVPIAFNEADSWFGGKPKLPKNMAWPEHKGVPLHFVCQINLAHLPAGLWSGVGPRDGWLAVFFHPEVNVAKVLHVRGEIEQRDGPGQMVAQWARTHAYYAAKDKMNFLPRWPVKIEQCWQADLTGLASVKLAPKAWKDEKPDLANPAIHPFDKNTLGILLDSLEEFLVQQLKRMCRFPATKKLRPNDLDWMLEAKALAFRSLDEFYRVEGSLMAGIYDAGKVASLLPKSPAFQLTSSII